MTKVKHYLFRTDVEWLHNGIVELHNQGRAAGLDDEALASTVNSWLAAVAEEHPDLVWPVAERTLH
jgi:hypothetical protein